MNSIATLCAGYALSERRFVRQEEMECVASVAVVALIRSARPRVGYVHLVLLTGVCQKSVNHATFVAMSTECAQMDAAAAKNVFRILTQAAITVLIIAEVWAVHRAHDIVGAVSKAPVHQETARQTHRLAKALVA
jgi:hypothetical protein